MKHEWLVGMSSLWQAPCFSVSTTGTVFVSLMWAAISGRAGLGRAGVAIGESPGGGGPPGAAVICV